MRKNYCLSESRIKDDSRDTSVSFDVLMKRYMKVIMKAFKGGLIFSRK